MGDRQPWMARVVYKDFLTPDCEVELASVNPPGR